MSVDLTNLVSAFDSGALSCRQLLPALGLAAVVRPASASATTKASRGA